LNESYV